MRREVPDVIAFELSKGKARLAEAGFTVGEIQLTQAPGSRPHHNLRIVKQQIRPNGRVDLIVVSEQSFYPGKEV